MSSGLPPDAFDSSPLPAHDPAMGAGEGTTTPAGDAWNRLRAAIESGGVVLEISTRDACRLLESPRFTGLPTSGEVFRWWQAVLTVAFYAVMASTVGLWFLLFGVFNIVFFVMRRRSARRRATRILLYDRVLFHEILTAGNFRLLPGRQDAARALASEDVQRLVCDSNPSRGPLIA